MPRHSAPQRPSWLRPRFVVAFVVATAGLVTAVWLPTRNDSADAAERNRGNDSRRSRSLPAFADDFTGTRGSTVDAAKWGLRTDRTGSGTQFSQSSRNVRLDGDGNLVIVLRGEDRDTFSTARLFSRGTLRGTSGHVEARVKAPEGEGLQPAVELVGTSQPNAGALNLLAEPVSDGDFHTYAVDWTPDEVLLSVDGQQVDQQAPEGFDPTQPFKLALSLSVTNDRDRADLPGRMTVDTISFSGADASAEPTEPPATEPPATEPTSPPASDPATEPPTDESPSSDPEPTATEPPATEPTSPAATTPPTTPPTSAPTATEWAPFTDYVAGQLVTYEGIRYQVQETHTSLPGWEPTALPALFKKI